jgi:hypothetical protein
MESLRQDVCGGLRVLRRSPGLTADAVITLALGIGVGPGTYGKLDSGCALRLPDAG